MLVLIRSASARLIEAYREQLLTLEELRVRMPTLRKRETTVQTQLAAFDAELHDAESSLKVTETLEGVDRTTHRKWFVSLCAK